MASNTEHTASPRGAAWLGVAHLTVDAACVAAVLRASPPSDSIDASALLFVLGYDLLAFAGQAPLGWLLDHAGRMGRHPGARRMAALLGLALAAASLAAGPNGGTAVMALAGLGNALFHLGAGAMVLAGANGRAAPAGFFVAPGALGLGIGLLLGRTFISVPLWPCFVALALSALIVWLVACHRPLADDTTRSPPPTQPPGQILVIGSLLAISVGIRSLVGTVGCDGCPRGLFLAIAIPMAGFAGKLAGGVLADRRGWIEVSVGALLASAPLLAFSGGDRWLALPGLLIFQMTMPVTLTAMARLAPRWPALGFGILCLALVAGTLPAYLPGGWRPQGIPVLLLVLGSAGALYTALRMLLPQNRPLAPVQAIVPHAIRR